jgi:GTPase
MSYRAGFVGVIGLPNSGKSTLVNKLVGEKVSIVSNKPQTTRRRNLGILTRESEQLVFVDAPGILTGGTGLNKFLMEEARDVIKESDVLLVVLNIDEPNFDRLKEMIQLALESKKPWLAIVHKTDLPEVHRPEILKNELSNLGIPYVAGSSLQEGDTFAERVLGALLPMIPEAQVPLYDPELFTPATERELCAEIVREKCFEALHQEIPYGTAVRILSFKENDAALLKIKAEVIVSKPNHQGMVVGKQAQVIKAIGTEARKDIEKLLHRKIFLELAVATSKDWQKNPRLMKEFGYAR